MDAGLRARLIASAAAQRLVIVCGAGLSQAAPSSLPSAYNLALQCEARYLSLIGLQLPIALRGSGDLEGISAHFLAEHQFGNPFLDAVVPWSAFTSEPNAGHRAIADFLECRAIEVAITTNFDRLIEDACASIGDKDFLPVIDCDQIASRHHSPLLKIHGCRLLDRPNTLWCHQQLPMEPLASRLARARDWMQAYLRGKDLVFVGFWSDWTYLNDVFASLTSSAIPDPRLRVLVDPSDGAVLEAKAPGLWAFAHQPSGDFVHVQESGGVFLDDLRIALSEAFWSRLIHSSLEPAVAANPLLAPPSQSSDAWYFLRRDLTGETPGDPVRHHSPQVWMGEACAAASHLLIDHTATVVDGQYEIGTKRVRVVSGRGENFSKVMDRFSADPSPAAPGDLVVCAGAAPDSRVLDIFRKSSGSTVTRKGLAAKWITPDELAAHLTP